MAEDTFFAHTHLGKIFLQEHGAYFDLLTTCFSKLQDIIGTKILIQILAMRHEDLPQYSVLARLNLLEKHKFLPSIHS